MGTFTNSEDPDEMCYSYITSTLDFQPTKWCDHIINPLYTNGFFLQSEKYIFFEIITSNPSVFDTIDLG